MALIVPDSSVSLYADVPISDGQELLFKSKSEQNTYFARKKIASRVDCTYLRKTGKLRIEWSTATVQRANFISFKNPSFENITFYARLLDWEYVNNNTTDVLYAIDYFQTFCFDVKYHACSIVREHLTETNYQKALANPWRRDIPELLTDEGLPVGRQFEKIYEETEQTSFLSGVYSGERFRVPNSAAEGGLNDRYISFFVSSFDWKAIDTLDKNAMTEFMNYWDNVNNSTDISLDTCFATWENGFVRSYGIFSIKYDNNTEWQDNMNKALNWFAIWGVTSAIIGVYVLPKYILQGLGDVDGSLIHVNLEKLEGVNPKLNTHPFRYIRIMSPLDSKEYRIDLFESAANPNSSDFAEFRLVTNCNGLPTIAIVPVDYSFYSSNSSEEGSVGYLTHLNYKERIEYAGFAQVGFSIDSYLTFLSNQYNDAIKTNTSAGMAATRAQGINAITSMASPITNALSTATGGDYSQEWTKTGRHQYEMIMPNAPQSFSVGTNVSAVSSAAASLYSADQTFDLQNEAMNRTGRAEPSEVFAGTKTAYVNDQYTPGSGGGLLAYQLRNIGFIFEIVTLNDDVLQKYSDFLDVYGYKSGRAGIPHVCEYLENGTIVPHFATYDGDTFTYVRTENMHVTGNLQVACTAIENLFNSGCQFLKGDMS